ncbi:MAG TPA: glucosamine-6-phosphate deaminase [Bacteroidales bacterium]|nr:glucosamine-6-phosphate deaminase [Bacteroidales bacterium]
MEVIISENRELNGQKAAEHGAGLIRDAIQNKGEANIILATGASQFEMLKVLVKQDIEWRRVRAFHLDEYIGLSETHPASFRRYLRERFADITEPKEFIYVNGSVDPYVECQRLGAIIEKHPVDVAFIGIGENGHLAFNDPPADFETHDPYLVVKLDEACRRQQMGEGWFAHISDVPERAISMSINQIMKSKTIICCVPELRKAEAVKKTLNSEITPEIPASVLRRHKAAWLYIDKEAATLL